jgi:hypothetical protein
MFIDGTSAIFGLSSPLEVQLQGYLYKQFT